MIQRLRYGLFTAVALVLYPGIANARSNSSVISYQGQLKEQGVPLTGTVDLEVSLFDVESGGVSLDVVELDNAR